MAELRLDMTITREELLRLLPAAVGPFQEEAGGYGQREPGRAWRIAVAPLPPLAAGLLRLERLRLELSFEGYLPEEQAAFLARFRSYTQRGGG